MTDRGTSGQDGPPPPPNAGAGQAEQPASTPGAPSAGPWYRRPIAIGGGVVLLVLVALFVGIAVGSTGSESDQTATVAADDRDDAEGERETTTTTEPTTTTERETTTTTTTTTEPPQEPMHFSGVGPDVIDLEEVERDPWLVHLSHDGESNFQVAVLDASGQRSEGLVNEIGSYNGVVPANFRDRDSFQFVEVNADGAWTVAFEPITTAEILSDEPGSTYAGTGDDVIGFFTTSPTMVEITCHNCESNFQVAAYSDRWSSLVNEVGQFSGTVLVPNNTMMLEITASTRRSAAQPEWEISVQ